MGERDTWALENRCSGGGWWEVPDLTPYTTRGEVAQVVADSFSGAADGKIANFSGQLWALRDRIQPGDLLVMPLKTTKQIAIGRVSGGYEYREHEDDRSKRVGNGLHCVLRLGVTRVNECLDLLLHGDKPCLRCHPAARW